VHRLFKHPGGDIRIRSGPLDDENSPGVDIRGDGAMAVAPPSRTRKGTYRWLNRRRIAKAPAWLLDMVIRPADATREPDVWEQFANSTRQVNISELTLACAMLPNPDIPWDPDKKTGTPGWNGIGMALFDASDGSVEGLRLFDAFSRRSIKKYNAKRTRDKWKAFRKCPPRKITAGTIFFLAEQSQPDWKSRIRSRDPKVIKLLREFHKLMGEP
jgi:hypothetical protein